MYFTKLYLHFLIAICLMRCIIFSKFIFIFEICAFINKNELSMKYFDFFLFMLHDDESKIKFKFFWICFLQIFLDYFIFLILKYYDVMNFVLLCGLNLSYSCSRVCIPKSAKYIVF